MLLMLVMLLGMLPVTALAAGPSADWYNFRNSDVNMGITNAATPKSQAYTQLKWASAFDTILKLAVLVLLLVKMLVLKFLVLVE